MQASQRLLRIFAQTVEIAFNQYLKLDPDASRLFNGFAGKVIELELKGFGLRFYIAPDIGTVRVLERYDGEPDTRIIGSPLALVQLGLGGAPHGAFFAGDVQIDGDLELGRSIQEAMNRIDVDWEEQLSKLVGDVVAHQVGQTVRGVAQWGRQSAETLGRDLVDYLRYEARDLAIPADVEQYLGQVDVLRDDVDRLEARVRRLQSAFAQRSS